jgi:hypothetical protein
LSGATASTISAAFAFLFPATAAAEAAAARGALATFFASLLVKARAFPFYRSLLCREFSRVLLPFQLNIQLLGINGQRILQHLRKQLIELNARLVRNGFGQFHHMLGHFDGYAARALTLTGAAFSLARWTTLTGAAFSLARWTTLFLSRSRLLSFSLVGIAAIKTVPALFESILRLRRHTRCSCPAIGCRGFL